MKKLFSFLLAALLLLGLSTAAFALGVDGTVETAPAPSLAAAAEVAPVFTSYAERGGLDQDEQALMVTALNTLRSAKDLAELGSTMSALKGRTLTVKYLFAVDLNEADQAKLPVEIVLKGMDLSTFGALVYYTGDEFEIVPATVKNGNLEFSLSAGGVYSVLGSNGKTLVPVGVEYPPVVDSVTNPGAPRVIYAETDDGSGAPVVVITPFRNRDVLPAAARSALEAADSSLNNVADVSELNSQLTAADGTVLAAIDLFDLSLSDNNPKHLPITLKLEDQGLENFFALITYQNGQWELIDCSVSDNAMNFTARQTGPYAVIAGVNQTTSAQTGEEAPYVYLAGAMLFLAAAAWFFAKSRKAHG